MTDTDIIEVVAAHAAGKKIQFSFIGCPNIWHDAPEPEWNFQERSYRVAPEPRKPREWEMFASDTNEIFLNNLFPNLKRIIVREVIE